MMAVSRLQTEKIQNTAPPVWLASKLAKKFLIGRKAEPTTKFAVQLRVRPSEVAVEAAYGCEDCRYEAVQCQCKDSTNAAGKGYSL